MTAYEQIWPVAEDHYGIITSAMKSAPNSRTNLDKAIQRFAGSQDFVRATELHGLMANAIVAQMSG